MLKIAKSRQRSGQDDTVDRDSPQTPLQAFSPIQINP